MLAVRGAGAALRWAWLHGPGPRRGGEWGHRSRGRCVASVGRSGPGVRAGGWRQAGGHGWAQHRLGGLHRTLPEQVLVQAQLCTATAAGSGLVQGTGVRGRPVPGDWRSCRDPAVPSRCPQHVVDLRSDTVTQPSEAMRRAMAQAAVGDDDYGEDPTVNELQHLAARLLGMEDALFVPTATMANLIAVMCHCQRRGAQLLLGAGAHLHVYEHGGVAQVAGVHSQALPDLPDGTLDLEQLELAVREAHGSRYHPRPELVCLENTHSSAGGRALPLAHLQQVHQLAERYGLRVHMDGARLLNAAVAQAVEPAQITQHCNSVSLCFSKGLGAPAGAVLAGRRAFVAEAWRVRKLLGGGMRQAGVLAAAARIGLEQAEATLHRDHSNARRFAQGIQELQSPLCSVSLPAVETNMVMVAVPGGWPSPAELCAYMRAVSEEELAETGHAVSVLLFPWAAHTLRAVWHRDVSAHDTELALNKLGFVARKCQERLALGLGPGPPSAAGH